MAVIAQRHRTVMPRILVADDNAINRKLLRAMLGKMGLVADYAHDGEETVRMAAEGEYDIVLMDCRMPRMNGYEATRELRRRLGDEVHIIGVTANAFPEDERRARAVGMNSYLVKPIAMAALGEALAGANVDPVRA